MLRFTLPPSTEFDPAGNYAENLRQTTVGGQPMLIPAGRPTIIADRAGTHVCRLPDGRLITVAADHRTVSVNAVEAGVLEADYRAAMADGERIVVFTDAGVQWISAGMLQPPAESHIKVNLTVAPLSVSLSAPVDAPSPLRGSYPRLSGTLQEVDCKLFASAFDRAMKSLSAQAALRGMLVGEARIGWRMLDSEGRTIAYGASKRFGSASTSTSLTFNAVKSDSTFTINGNPSLSASAWTLGLSVERSSSDFWRRRARTLELLLWADCSEAGSATGRFTESSPTTAALTVTPEIRVTDGSEPVIAARFDLPLEGLDTRVYFSNIEAYDPASASAAEEFIPATIGYGGTLRAYAPLGEQGVIAIAQTSDPLAIRLRGRICDGRIMRICVPVGNGGGWNYGRHHFLAFTTAGIFAVSIDSALKSVSAAPVSTLAISRPDAVTAATDAIYCATDSGVLLKLQGAKIRRIDCPVRAVAATWVNEFTELLVIDSSGNATALTAGGMVSRRSHCILRSFVEPAMAITAAGELVDLSREQDGMHPIVWRRRVAASGNKLSTRRMATFDLDAQATAALRLTIAADNGGGSQRLLELTVNGPVNAPLTARYRAPRRRWLTFAVNGLIGSSARLTSIADSAIN